VVLRDYAARLPRLVLGRPGQGKSVYLGRDPFLAGAAHRQTIILDGKGDADFTAAVVDAYTAGWMTNNGVGRPTIQLFPAEPLTAWQGSPAEPAWLRRCATSSAAFRSDWRISGQRPVGCWTAPGPSVTAICASSACPRWRTGATPRPRSGSSWPTSPPAGECGQRPGPVRLSDPDELVRLAGTVLEAEAVHATEDGVWRGRASVTHCHRAKVDANSVRQLGVGEAIVVSRGRAARMLVIPAPAANNGLHASLPSGNPASGRPGRSLARRAATWPSTASRVLRIPSGHRSGALDPPAVQSTRDDASPRLGEDPARPASAPEGGARAG
jgi:hypothetical protein